jgi:hypothetical protein
MKRKGKFGALVSEVIGQHTEAQWQEKITEQGNLCFWCGSPVCDPVLARACNTVLDKCSELVKDHLVPISRGGVDFIWNIVAACAACNQLRGNRMPGEFLKDRLSYAQPVDNGKKIYTAIPASRERTSACIEPEFGEETDDSAIQSRVKSHIEVSRVTAQFVNSLSAMMPKFPPRDDDYYKRRRETLLEQAATMIPRMLEAAGQMRLEFRIVQEELAMPSSVKKFSAAEALTLTEEQAMVVRNGIDIA